MPTLDVYLAAAVVLLALAVLVLLFVVPGRDGQQLHPDHLRAQFGATIRELNLDSTAGQIETHAREMREIHGDIEQMLRTPQHRGGFGEEQLEVILQDQLPPDMYGVREAVVGNKTPDAHIETSEGVICIDSKFPLDQYEAYLEADPESEEAARAKRAFRAAVEGQLSKVAEDYVRPEAGTAAFAFAFIPSESVYYHLVTTEYGLLREFSRRGVQVVSPLTFGHKLELIKAGVHAKRLSQEAAQVQDRLQTLRGRFEAFGDEWSTFMRHVTNAKNKADDADAEFDRLRDEFDRIDDLAPVDDPDATGVDD
jgi:DNA recombination protein RmuC